ncbi:MAG: ATP-dependent RecD-like DNA helicase [Methylocella sp.]
MTPHNQGDSGTVAINLAVRKALRLPEGIVEGDLLLVVKNNYKAQCVDDPNETVIIFNGERCTVIVAKQDFIDVEFSRNSEGVTRRVRLLSDDGKLPEGVAFGYAMSVHKAQGSQFSHVIATTERGSKAVGIVQKSSIYTACSRARNRLTVIGDVGDFVQASLTPEIPRKTLLKELLTSRSRQTHDERVSS